MDMSRIAIRSVLFFVAFFATRAHAFFDPLWISPENPVADETISINIHGGVCDTIFGEEGYPQITRDGNAIRMRWFGQHYPEGSGDLLCSYPVGTLVEPIGAYAAGDYTITVELAYDDFLEGPSILTIGVVPFTVAGTPNPSAVPAPTLDAVGAFVLLALLTGLSLWKLPTGRASWLVFALVCVPLGVRAEDKTIRVLVSASPGAPTPTAVVTWVNSSPRGAVPPLNAFNVKSPLAGGYLIPDRATGDFLAWLNANPHSVRKKLEDYVLLSFASADVPAALAALQADPNVAEASEETPYTLSSAELTNFEIVSEPGPLGGYDQYGYYSMNV